MLVYPENPSNSHYRSIALYGQRFIVGDKPQRYENPIFMPLWHAERDLSARSGNGPTIDTLFSSPPPKADESKAHESCIFKFLTGFTLLHPDAQAFRLGRNGV